MSATKNNYEIADDFTKKCENFTKLILSYNKIHNITGAKDSDSIRFNIEDSIYPIPFLPPHIEQAIDVGSGAGFPGLILAMALPQIHFTLFEPIKKKSAFLHLAKTSLYLKNVDIISQRVEAVAPFEADLVCSRAVTKTEMLLKLCQNFISAKTTLLFYKGTRVQDEIKNLENYRIYENGNRNYLLMKTEGTFK
ncbi:16S rRNA (guanine(527)-N(7))-methyltransferase RsmG [Sulfurospirillum sp. 1612]|uniref:16S rRNA (guanine(527)-N(7))-methyltransferase RsmG n=1 Tax=Sulfurospirillum sp. 1612 TaxID=3094835 RepID=UPI002F92F2EB